jgi:peptide/nickel transport system substrate-binding protein
LEGVGMTLSLRMATVIGAMLAITCWGQAAFAQKSGGTLKISFFDNPASMSLHEEATGAALRPMMGVFNNLVMYDQHVAQNSPDSIIPDLATSWAWSEDGKELAFPLRRGVKWHDGRPFTAAASNAPGISCSTSAAKSSVSIRARPGISTSTE